jgi:single stranded DNA-binding protein
MNLNRVLLIGNPTRDPEVRSTHKGTPVAEIGLAVNRVYSAEGGEKKEETTFIDVTIWGRQAETAGQYLKKGRSVFIEGRLRLDTWEDKQTGQKRSKLRVVGENMQLLGSKESAGSPSLKAPAAAQNLLVRSILEKEPDAPHSGLCDPHEQGRSPSGVIGGRAPRDLIFSCPIFLPIWLVA